MNQSNQLGWATSFHSWQKHDGPIDAMHSYSSRARNLLSFARCMLDQWSQKVYMSEGCPSVDLYYADVQGLLELLSVVGENIDLTVCAAKTAEKRTNQTALDVARTDKG